MKEIHSVAVRYISRREFLRRLSAVAVGTAVGGALGGCGPTAEPTAVAPATQAPPTTAPVVEEAGGEVGGQLDFFSWEGYDMLSATEKWRADNGIDLKSGYIASSEDTAAKVLSPAGAGIDVITYAYPYYQAWGDLGVFSEFTVDEVPNIKRMYPFFQEGKYWRTSQGNYIGVPLTWLTYVCNYRSDLIDPPQTWAELIEPQYAGKVAIVEDPAANILVASAVLGLPTETMTKSQLEEVKQFLLALKANAKTIAPSYGDLSNLLISGEAAATFVGWGALDVWGQADGVAVSSVLPEDGVVLMVDAYAIPPTTDNRPTALAWLNEMLSDEVQLSVVNDLLTATVVPDVVPLIEDEGVRNLYDYDNLQTLFEENPLKMFPPTEATGDQVTFADWLKVWEEVKAS
ncbi:MAG TPA: extracellular solute-binding protein [Anaerolineae bacterium]|nr:extracellular solute-binding protein [Anaerolineae bacterium]